MLFAYYPPPAVEAHNIERFIDRTFAPISSHFKNAVECIPHISSPLGTTVGQLQPPLVDKGIFSTYDITKMQATWLRPPLNLPKIQYNPDQTFEEATLDSNLVFQAKLHDIRTTSDMEFRATDKEATFAQMFKEEPYLEQMVTDAYTRTLERFGRNPVGLRYEHEKRFEHTQIVGGSGAGKTTLLSHLLLHDLNQPDPPGIVLIDPKRTVIDKLSKLALFDGPLKDRLIIVRPEYAPAINIFDPTGRSSVGAVQSLVYLCSALASAFTDRQRGLATNLARLLLVFPQTLGRNATFYDLQDLMVDKFPSKFQDAAAGLQPNQRSFFEPGGFDNPEYRDAKRQIRARLDTILGSDKLDSLFSSQTNAINIYAELDKGSIILVDTGEGSIEDEESSAFGCIFFAEVVRAVMQRNAIDPDQRRPAFLYVDEAATFFKGDMTYFFTAARQCNIGGIFAFHSLAQAERAGVRDSLRV